MELTTLNRWRTSLIISLLFNSMVIIGAAGIISQSADTIDAQETMIELAMENEADNPLGVAIPGTNPARVQLANQVVEQPQPLAADELAMAPTTASVGEMAVISSGGEDLGEDNLPTMNGGSAATAGAGNPGSGSSSGGGITSGSSGVKSQKIIPPQILRCHEPAYPETVRQAGIEGTVVLKIQILENGRAGGVSIYKSSGSELLDEAAAADMPHWRFVPAKVRETGQPIGCYITLPVVFSLRS
ncbi:MAG: hypothetical protein H6Q74_725 [Firmicutes bacterium]|nr:hypothetical protein [Bacillota bacterium]